jgi:hypothetical protein
MDVLADEDRAFLAFRRGLRDMRERNFPLPSTMLHVEQRIEKVYQEAFGSLFRRYRTNVARGGVSDQEQLEPALPPPVPSADRFNRP